MLLVKFSKFDFSFNTIFLLKRNNKKIIINSVTKYRSDIFRYIKTLTSRVIVILGGNKMKKYIRYIAMFLGVSLVLVGCSTNNEGSINDKSTDELVVYTPSSDDIIDTIIPAFEEETGIEVKVVAAATGELLTRIENEAENPIADVMWGGSPSLIAPLEENFIDYISTHDEELPKEFRNIDGKYTPTHLQTSVLLVNNNLVEKGAITGYSDLLKEEYKGKIAHGDAAGSSSAFNHLENMLFAVNEDEPLSDESWEFVEDFLRNLDGKIVNSSGAIHQGVANGEYAVGLTYESAALEYLKDESPVEIVYMDEGVVYKTSINGIIKGADNIENAKKFNDFLVSEKGQNLLGVETISRPIREDAELADYKPSLSEINIIDNDYMWGIENKELVTDRYMEYVITILE